ncbi:MAG: flagellar biosynthesis protein FlgL [Bradyrhizobiaceae bacterium]|nr:MAG: flagellar biosynthesis protein FlgL [Bradyrhizobiaceae bacterium]
MTIDGVSGRTNYIGTSILNLQSQLNTLSEQLTSGKKANTYSGLGVQSGFATGLRSQLSALSAYSDTATMLNTRIGVVNLSLQGLIDAGSETKTAATGSSLTLNEQGQTPGQQTANASFTQAIALLNTESGGRYLFSGRATDTPSTASADEILNGTTSQAGLRQLISERKAADLGTGTPPTGRLVTAQAGTSVSISEDATGSPFGLKLSAISSSLTGSSVTSPPTTAPTPPSPPASESVDLGATNPKDGDSIQFTFQLPDGTSESISLTASSANPPPAGSFAIGADTTETAANLKGALDTAIGNLANGPLVAASAVAASNNFFADPPQRVGSSPFSSATTLVDGTPANTVTWYTGEKGTDSARGTAVASVDPSVSVQYGARANEQAIVDQLKSIAVYAAVTTNPNDPNANAQITALNQRVQANLAVQPGAQSIQNIQSDFAGAQAAVKAATTRQTQTTSMAQSMLDSIEGVDDNEVATQIMALQTSLQASYQTTSMLYQTNLLKYLPIG